MVHNTIWEVIKRVKYFSRKRYRKKHLQSKNIQIPRLKQFREIVSIPEKQFADTSFLAIVKNTRFTLIYVSSLYNRIAFNHNDFLN